MLNYNKYKDLYAMFVLSITPVIIGATMLF